MKRIIALVALLCSAFTLFAAGSGSKEYSGKTVTLLIHPTLYKAAGGDNGIKKEFEERTGAKVEVVLAPSPEHTEKAMLDFLSHAGSFDVINFTGAELSKEICSNLLPLDSLIAASPEYEFNDIIPGISAVGKYNGKQLAIGYRMTQVVSYYRKDLFAKAGIPIPTTWDELYVAAKALTKDTNGDGKIDVYGFTAAGKAPDELSQAWLNAFYGYGGQIVQNNGRSGFNTPAGIKAANLWKKFYQEGIFPPDYFAWGRDDFINAMAQGRTAYGCFTASYYGNFISGKITPEQVGFSPTPNGGINRSNGWYLAVNKDSKNAKLAWELVKELTSKTNQLREALQWANGPTRTSTYQNAEYRKTWPQSDALIVAADNIVRDPTTKEIPRILAAITEEITYIMQNKKTTEQGMADLTKRVDELLGF